MINYKSLLRHFIFYFIINLIGLGLFAYMRHSIPGADAAEDPVILKSIKQFGHIQFLFTAVLLFSFMLAAVTSLVDVLLFKKIHLRLPLGPLILVEIIVQIIVVNIVWKLVLEFVWHAVLNIEHVAGDSHGGENLTFIMVLLFFLIGLGRLTIAVDRKLGHGNIWKLMTGQFYKPKEEERLFMFIDLKDSAKIAEQIGHMKFSQFIKDCFSDLSVVDRFRAEIYQFVGDEVVLTWCNETAFRKNNYLKAFYAFKNELKNKSSYYLDNYGIEPYFKAGVHAGLIVTTEVGDLKREISYHGDTINTAARIQGLCNQLNADLLISEEVLNLTPDKDQYNFIDQGLNDLKGKKESARVFKVEVI